MFVVRCLERGCQACVSDQSEHQRRLDPETVAKHVVATKALQTTVMSDLDFAIASVAAIVINLTERERVRSTLGICSLTRKIDRHRRVARKICVEHIAVGITSNLSSHYVMIWKECECEDAGIPSDDVLEIIPCQSGEWWDLLSLDIILATRVSVFSRRARHSVGAGLRMFSLGPRHSASSSHFDRVALKIISDIRYFIKKQDSRLLVNKGWRLKVVREYSARDQLIHQTRSRPVEIALLVMFSVIGQ